MSGLEEVASASASAYAVSTLSELRERERESIYIILNIRLGRKEVLPPPPRRLVHFPPLVRLTQIQSATVNSPKEPGAVAVWPMLSCRRCTCQRTLVQLTVTD